MIFIDSNVFVIDLRYPRDANFEANQSFLRAIKERRNGATTLANLLEIVGVLSFNLSPQQLRELIAHLPTRYGIRVVPALDPTTVLAEAPVSSLMAFMEQRMSFGDALVLWHVSSYAKPGDSFVTWDAGHFEGKTHLALSTPQQFMAR